MKRNKYLLVALTVLVFVVASIPSICLAEQVKLKFGNWHMLEPGRGDLLKQFVAEFMEKNPNVKVTPLIVPWRDYSDKFAVAFGAGGGPDVLQVKEIDLAPWVNLGFLARLDEYIDFAPFEDMMVKPAEKAVINGKRYGVPFDMGIYAGLIYNTLMFKEVGLEPPTNPDEFLEAAKKLTKAPEQFGLAHPVNPGNPSYLMQGAMIFINGYGGTIARKGVITVNEPEFIEGVKAVKRFYDAEVVPKGMDFSTQRKMLWAGKVAMVLDGPYLFAWIERENPQLYPYMTATPTPFPTRHTPGGIHWYSVSGFTNHKLEAAKLVEFLLQPEQQRRWAELSVAPVGLKQEFAFSAEWLAEHSWFRVYLDGVYYAVPRIVEGLEMYTAEIRKTVSDYIGDVLIKDVPAEVAMNECKKSLDELIQRKKAGSK